MLRNQSPGGKSPSPGPITNTLPVKPIGPPSHNEPISATPTETTPTNKKWGSKNLAETLKGEEPYSCSKAPEKGKEMKNLNIEPNSQCSQMPF